MPSEDQRVHSTVPRHATGPLPLSENDSVPRPGEMGSANAKLILIGWHAADWKALHPILDSGRMPNLHSLIERGVSGNLKPSGPISPAAFWTSLATGKSANLHGIAHGFELDPLTGGTHPAGSTGRRVKALWNIAMQAERKTHLVGWAATQPAERLNGCCVTPGFVQPLTHWTEPWPVLPGSLYPSRLMPELMPLRVHAGELAAQDLRHFIPSLSEIDQEKDRRVVELADTLAQTISTHAIATWLLEHEPWDLMMIGWSGLERACHAFARYAAPQLNGVTADDCALYGRIVTELYCYYDALLGRIVQLAGAGTTIALVSVAGFRSGSERPTCEALQAKPAAWYRPYGIFCMVSPNIVADELVHNVTMMDVAPTMLSVLGVPAAHDMPGRVITEALASVPPPERIASWEEMDGSCGMHPPDTLEDKARIAATLDDLAKLGYLNALGTQAVTQTEPCDPKQKLREAYDHFRSGNYAASSAALLDAPTEGFEAAHSKILESHLETARGNSTKALAAIETAERLGSDRPLIRWAAGWMYLRHGNLSRSEAALRQAVKLDPSFEQARSLLAHVLVLLGKCEEAGQQALSGLSVDYASASLHAALGLSLLQAGARDKALQAFQTSLAFDPRGKEATAWAEKLAQHEAPRPKNVYGMR